MKFLIITILLIFSTSLIGCSEQDTDKSEIQKDISPDTRVKLAKCMTQNGWVVYSSFTCSACTAQKKLFGEEAFTQIKEIECNPHAPDTNVELCVEKKIQITPTWMLEKEGLEVMRVAKYQLLEDLAMHSDCEFQAQHE